MTQEVVVLIAWSFWFLVSWLVEVRVPEDKELRWTFANLFSWCFMVAGTLVVLFS